ncbi:MAG: glycosyltransferase family 2 protein [Anaerolineae bacterium]
MPYQSSGGRRNNVQLGVGQSIWAGTPPTAIPERVLDGIPGCLTWMALLLTVVGAVAFPRSLLVIAIVVALYSAFRFLLAGVAAMLGLRTMRQWRKIDWYERYVKTAPPDALAWDDVHHVIIIPNYKEPQQVLERTLENLASQYEARQRITIVLAMEAAEDGCIEKANCLHQQFAGKVRHFYHTVHPRGLPGEMQCKSANEAWAARWIKRRLVDELGYDMDHILVTTMDADTLWHPNFFYALTYLFAINPNRHLRFWQGQIRYHSNVWEVSPPMRLLNAYSTALELGYLGGRWWTVMPMSSYTLSLRLLDTSGYWDSDVIADEWHMYVKAFFARDGEVKVERVFMPFLAQATTGETTMDLIRNRYLQTLRHAWGVKEVGYTIAKMLEHPEIEFGRALRLLVREAHDNIQAGAGWVIMTIGSQLPILLHPQLLGEITQPGNPLFLLLQGAAVLVVVMGILFWYIDVITRPPRTRRATLKERLLVFLSFPLLSVLSVIFLALPTIQAQTRLLIGAPLQFRVTKKL